ncbi:MAG: ATP-binding protein [Ignavibacteriales bacterium]|nr:ATP-binding protein [Ignavibacteriales bacterium]
MNIIGKVAASEKQPTSVDEFSFWLKDDVIIRPFDIVKVDHYKNSHTYGVVEEIMHMTDDSGYFNSYVSSDFGDVLSEPMTLKLGINYAKCKVISNHSKHTEEQIYMPLLDGSKVYFCSEKEIIEALGLDAIDNPIPAGFIEMSNNISVPISFNSDFLIGPEGAHLNISGISGLATKTSYAMFLLQAIQQKRDDIAYIILNVKGADLLRLDELNPKMQHNEKEDYERCGLKCKPFENVNYYYPFKNDPARSYSNTYLKNNVLINQNETNRAFNFIYTYEETCNIENQSNQLDLLFSNIDDPARTIESILNEITESYDFQGLDWNSFKTKLSEYTATKKQGGKQSDILVQSWKRFSRLIKKSISNDIFQINKGPNNMKQRFLKDEITRIKKNEVFCVDIAKLDEQLQCFVFGDIVRSVYELKLGQTDRAEEDIPKRIIVFVDELNKYASTTSPKTSPILNSLLEITERGRSMGIILFSAEQFRSAINDKVTGNCSTSAYGRTNAIEISKPGYRFIPKVFNNMMTRLGKGDLIIEHPIFRSLLKIQFPFPSYNQNTQE